MYIVPGFLGAYVYDTKCCLIFSWFYCKDLLNSKYNFLNRIFVTSSVVIFKNYWMRLRRISELFGYIVMLRARMFRSLIPVLMIKERNIRARNIAILNNYWMRSSRIWGIIKAEVTQTEALIIPHILQEPNSIVVLLFICICKPFPWRSHLYFEFWYKQHKPFVFCIWHKQHKLVWRHKVV